MALTRLGQASLAGIAVGLIAVLVSAAQPAFGSPANLHGEPTKQIFQIGLNELPQGIVPRESSPHFSPTLNL